MIERLYIKMDDDNIVRTIIKAIGYKLSTSLIFVEPSINEKLKGLQDIKYSSKAGPKKGGFVEWYMVTDLRTRGYQDYTIPDKKMYQHVFYVEYDMASLKEVLKDM